MARLILMRHAKSAWDDPALADHDRPLNRRGRSAAATMGTWLADRGHAPAEVLCSTALRTRQTWDIAAAALAKPPQPRLDRGLYLASPDAILGIVATATAPVLLVVGHNPGIGALAGALAAIRPRHPDFDRFPTAATLVLDFPGADWTSVPRDRGEVVDFAVPRQMDDPGAGD